MKKYFFLITALLLLSGHSIMGADSTSTNVNTLRIELKLFSGRPNPTFDVTNPDEIKQIMQLTQALPKNTALAASAEVSKLGYTGIVIANDSSISPELESVTVNHNNVQVNINSTKAAGGLSVVSSGRQVREDAGWALENYLLQLARTRGVIDDNLVQVIKRTR